MFIRKKTLINIVDDRIRAVITDKTIARTIAMEYLVELSKVQLNRFYEAVELRRKSDAKIAKLDEQILSLDSLDGLEYEESGKEGA